MLLVFELKNAVSFVKARFYTKRDRVILRKRSSK